MVRTGFRELKLNRIYAMCEANNTASARVLEKAGLKRTEVRERHCEAKGRWWDMYLYEKLRAEWAELK